MNGGATGSMEYWQKSRNRQPINRKPTMRLTIVTRPPSLRVAPFLVGGALALLNLATVAGQVGPKYDPLDPANYVCVSEQTMLGRNYALFGNEHTCPSITPKSQDSGEPGDTSNTNALEWSAPSAEVDRGSRILIRFTRDRLLSLSRVAGAIGITGTISKAGSPGSAPPIEILGYWEVGQEARTASVRIRSVADIRASMEETAEVAARLDKLITEALNDAAVRADAFGERSLQRNSALRNSVDTLTRKLNTLRTTADSLHLLLIVSPDTAPQDTVRATRSFLLDQRVDEISRMARARTDALQEMSRLPRLEDKRREFEQQARDSIREAIAAESAVLATVLTMLSAPTDTIAMDRMVSRLGGHGPLLRAEAAGVISALKVIQDAATPVDKAIGAVEQVQRFLNKVARLYSAHAAVADAIRADMILDIRDAMIDLGASAAEPGDHITLTISYTDESRVSRALRIRLRVRQFGLVQHTGPSLLLVNRLGVDQASYPPTDPTPGRTSDPHRYRATPGFTFGWSLHTRRQWGPQWVSTLVRWLDPGIGVNVSFPRFSTTLVRLEEETVNGATTTRTVTETDNGPDLQIGAGPVLSFFGGALQLAMGYNLMSERDGRYIGLGFSFVDLIGKIKEPAR